MHVQTVADPNIPVYLLTSTQAPRSGKPFWFLYTNPVDAALRSYVEKSVDERVITRVAHCQPVRAQPYEADVLVPATS